MGILERMRSGSDSTFMQVVMALIVISFVGVYSRTDGDRSGVVATVNGVKILDTAYGRAYRNELRGAEQQQQRTLSDAEQKQLGEQVRQRLIEREVMLQEAKRLGLEVSDSEIARQLLGIPFLRGTDGKFDPEVYAKFLKRQQYTKADFEETIRQDLLRAKLQQLVYTGASLSEPAIRETFIEQSTRVDLNVVRVRPSAFESEVAITDADRTTWLAENEALVQENYDRDLERLYNHPEQVHLRMIRLALVKDGLPLSELVPKINDLRDQVTAGGDMGELAKRWSEDPSAAAGGDLGLRPVAQLSSEETKSIDGLKAGELSRAVVTDRDVRLIRVEERIAPKVDTIDEVRNTIADGLIRAERVPVLAANFAEQELLPKWKETGAPPEELLAPHGLSARPTGPIPTTGGGNPFAPPQRLLDAARTAALGAVLPEVYEAGGVMYVAQLTNRIEPDLSEYEAQKTRISEAVLLSRRQEFYTAWIDDLKSQAKIQ
ncbi:MAG: SurA N-terminal domain-containing protein [Myxococcota bacterium]